jgi:hypothetical protein
MKKIALATLMVFFESNTMSLSSCDGSVDVEYRKSKLESNIIAAFHCETSPGCVDIYKCHGHCTETYLTRDPKDYWNWCQHMCWDASERSDRPLVKHSFGIWWIWSVSELATSLSRGFGCKVIVTEPE